MPGILNDHIDQTNDVATLCSGLTQKFPAREDQNTWVTLQGSCQKFCARYPLCRFEVPSYTYKGWGLFTPRVDYFLKVSIRALLFLWGIRLPTLHFNAVNRFCSPHQVLKTA
jgi:hypothetical protein